MDLADARYGDGCIVFVDRAIVEQGVLQKLAYLRPNLLHMGKLVLIPFFFGLLLLWLARRSVGPAGAHATVDVLLFLFGWF